MTIGKQLKIEDVQVNWDDAMDPFSYDEVQGCNLFDASKTAHNQRVAAVEAHEQAQEELQEQLEAFDNELGEKQLEDICVKGIHEFICNDDNADKIDCSVLTDLFDDYLETTNTPTSDDFLTYLYNLDAETEAEIYVD